MSELNVTTWGNGTPVVFVHGSLVTGVEEWHAQQPLAEEGFCLVVPDRRGYGGSPTVHGEDFLRDADDVAELLGDGAHVVAHSYGGLGAMLAASRRPEATLSLALLEPPAFTVVRHDSAGHALVEDVRDVFDAELPDQEWLVRFLKAVGTDPATLPAGVLEEVAPFVPLVRRSRKPWECDLPTAALTSAPFPKLVVSGGHSDAFDAICDALAERIDAECIEVSGAGHEIQFVGPPLNQALLDLWRKVA
ncbi:alpha/beta fold hydrolase [Haloechinothrix salitolerans]|uniref:Alpha/beta fold hydrolase n=1 Tax=Haloechinothrix salitolerans TaxID=926830 RepID=A0ABW2BUQ5_9PSEU